MLNNFTSTEEQIGFSNDWDEEDVEDLVAFSISQLDIEN